jgi:hypothetical protein
MLSIPNSFIKQSMQCGLHSKTILLAALSVGVKHVFSNIWVFKDYCSASAHRLIAVFFVFVFFILITIWKRCCMEERESH